MAAHAGPTAPRSILHRARRAGALAATPLDTAGYWLTAAGVYVLLGFLWYYSAKEKIFDDDLAAPAPIDKQFSGTFIDSFPGTDAAWAILGIVEGLVFLGIVVSLTRGEFLPHQPKGWLLASLAGSLVVFALMLFAQTMTKQFDSVASLYTYFGVTAVLMGLVRLMPPYRSDRWLTGGETSPSSGAR